MIATILGGAAITLRRAKRQSVKAQIVKKSEIKKQRKEKILDDMEVSATVMPDEETYNDNDSFVVEEKYERVAWRHINNYSK